MEEEYLYGVVEGPNGTAEIWIVPQGLADDRYTTEHSARPWDTVYEVRYGDERQGFWQEGEAATVACQLVGIPYGGDTGPRPAGPRRGVALYFEG